MKFSKKIITVVGTRPELIKLSRVIAELDHYFHHILVHTGQNYDYELNEIFFQDLDIRKPDYFLGVSGGTTAETIGNVIVKTDEVFSKEKPDAVLLYGDTNSCLSVIAAKRRKIPVFHMEAGNRCFDQRVPEELNRKIVDHLSDINLVLTEQARGYLHREGIAPETVIKTGSSMAEVLKYYEDKIADSKILDALGLKNNKYFVVSCHREENIDSEKNFKDFIESLNQIATLYKMPLIVSTHPRTRKKINSLGVVCQNYLVKFIKPLGFIDYIRLQQESFCVISDSGTVTEESSILGFPAITIRQAHERPEGMDEGTLIMSGLEPKNVIESINLVTSQYGRNGRMRLVKDYDTYNVSTKVVRIIMSYIDYVNRTVWRQQC
jgi:UDP-N-acetylglucosamine 2-epimerase